MRCYIWLFFLLTISPFQIYATATNNIPETLKPWINWVLDDNSQHQCPFFYNTSKTKYCAWPGQLTLDIQAQQGQFSSDWQVYNDSFITLPGSPEYWPQDVSINDKPAVVISRNNKPTIELKAGHHQIEGTFFWDNLPNSLTIPEQTGIISVSILNKPFPFPIINMQQLWFKTGVSAKTEPENRTDQLNLQVYRQVYDNIPLQLITHLSLEVSGSQRKIKLPYALLKGFIPISLNSKLPARLEPDGSLLVQVRAGLWNIELTAQYPSQLENLKLDINDPQWPATEIWSFAAQPQLRVVEIENLQTIDPSQSNVPTQWKKLQHFLLNNRTACSLKLSGVVTHNPNLIIYRSHAIYG